MVHGFVRIFLGSDFDLLKTSKLLWQVEYLQLGSDLTY